MTARATSSRAASSRYSPEPRTSSIGASSLRSALRRAASSPAGAACQSGRPQARPAGAPPPSRTRPRQPPRGLRHRHRARRAPPPWRSRSPDSAAHRASGKPKCRATERFGTRIAVTISSDRSAVLRLPKMKSASGRCRAASAERNSTSASSIISGGTPSAAGEALQRLPAIVPTFWICTEPTSRAACFNASKAGGRSSARHRSRWCGRQTPNDRRFPRCREVPSDR